jgi:PIN domain nuclease of toxin-antitoxin system
MNAVLLDTHAWAWSLIGSNYLSEPALEALSHADKIFVSPISFFEIGQKVRIGKWPAMEPFVGQMKDLLERQGGSLAELDAEICLRGALMAWDHRDPFDRLLAATALQASVPLMSADQTFDQLTDLTRIW